MLLFISVSLFLLDKMDTVFYNLLSASATQEYNTLLHRAASVTLKDVMEDQLEEEFFIKGQLLNVKKYTSTLQYSVKKGSKTYKAESTYDR